MLRITPTQSCHFGLLPGTRPFQGLDYVTTRKSMAHGKAEVRKEIASLGFLSGKFEQEE